MVISSGEMSGTHSRTLSVSRQVDMRNVGNAGNSIARKAHDDHSRGADTPKNFSGRTSLDLDCPRGSSSSSSIGARYKFSGRETIFRIRFRFRYLSYSRLCDGGVPAESSIAKKFL